MSIATGQINIQNIDETLSVSLSSDSHVFPGAVSTALAGQVDVEVEAFLGAKQIDCSIDAITPTPPKELTITVVPTQSKTKIVRFAAATNLSQSGTYNIYVNAAGTTVKKTFSYAIAFKGKTGNTGPKGATGVGVSSITEYYLATAASSGVTSGAGEWSTKIQTITADKKYLWNYEKVNFDDGTSSPTLPVIIGVYGNTGATGRALTGITEYYLASATASGVTRPSTDGSGGWTTAMQPTSISKPYLWNYEKLTWSVTPTTTYVEPIVIGVHGPQGPQGPQGSRGPQGIQGPIGPDGKATYTWIKYADTPTTGMKDLPDGKKYMGIAHNKPTATESTAYGDYTWSLIQGPQGNQGVQGPIGPNGQPTYTWIKYADDATGSGMNDSPTGKRFLGLAHNKTTATEGTKASDYQWSPLYDNVQVGGRNLLLNSKTLIPSRPHTIVDYLGYKNVVKILNPVSATYINPQEQYSDDVNSEEEYILSVDFAYEGIKGPTPQLYIEDYKSVQGDIEEGKFNRIYIKSRRRGRIHMNFSGYSGIYLTNWKLEKGNIPTDWTPAPEDVEERLVSHDARIDTTEREVALRATKTAVGSIDTRLKAAELKVTADAITSTVRKSTEYINDQGKKVSTNEIISKINQSAEKITIEASKINIKGKVTFESFDSSTAAEINSKARTFTSTPVPPYSLGDIWKNSTSTYMCKVARATGSYVAADWEKTGDVTSANKAADTSKVGGTAAATVVTGATAGSAAKTATDRWTYTGKTTIDGGKIQTDTVTAVQIKANTITAKEIEANTITVDELASSVGGSLDLSSNTAITSRVTSSELGTALNGKEDSLYKQASAPPHKVGRLWLETDKTPNVLYRSTGSAWVKATPTEAKEVGAYSSADGSALATRVSSAELKIQPGSIKSTVETQVKNNGSTVLATKSDITQTERDWTAKFSSIGGTNMLTNSSFSENLKNTGATSGVSIVLKDGRNSARIKGSFGRTDTVSWSVLGKVEPNEKYTMSGWVKLENIKSGPTNYTIMYYADGNSSGTWYGWGSKQIPANTSLWQYVTHTFTAPSASILNSATSCNVYLYARDFTGTVYFRDLQLEKGEIATDWSPHPEELYTGITRIDKDGVTVGRSGSETRTELAHNGLNIYDGPNELASFGDVGAKIKEATIDKLITTDAVLNYEGGSSGRTDCYVGNGKQYPNVSAVFSDLFYTKGEFRSHIVNDSRIDIYIQTDIQDNIAIYGIHGSGSIYIWFENGATLNGNIDVRDNTCRVYVRQRGGGHPRGKIKDDKSSWATIVNLNSAFLMLIGIDMDVNGNDYGVGGNDGGVTVLQDWDCSGARVAAARALSGHSVRAFNSRGNAPTGFLAQRGGAVYLAGTTVRGSSKHHNADLGYVVTQGTLTPTDSAFIKPPLTNKTFTYEIPAKSLSTYNYTSGFVSSYYGNKAAQGKYTGMSGWMEGRVVFGTNVASKFAGATSIKTYVKLKRSSPSHGPSAAVKPKSYGFTATWSTGATLGKWTSYAEVPRTLFSTSGDSTLKFRGTALDSDYAIWDNAMVKVVVVKRV